MLYYIIYSFLAPSSLSWTVEIRRGLSNYWTGFISKYFQINATPLNVLPPLHNLYRAVQLHTVQYSVAGAQLNPVQELSCFQFLRIDRLNMGSYRRISFWGEEQVEAARGGGGVNMRVLEHSNALTGYRTLQAGALSWCRIRNFLFHKSDICFPLGTELGHDLE
jgi:hypothetical protein